jgi:DNA primase
MWVDKKYISLLSGRLEKFKWKSENLANCRCCLCGDSKTNKNKKRFYFYDRKGEFYVKCWNCDYSASFQTFLKRIDPFLYSEYLLEAFADKNISNVDDEIDAFKQSIKISSSDEITTLFQKYKKISQLDWNHPAKMYIEKRKIPNFYHSQFRWIPNYCKWVNDNIIANKFSEGALKYDAGRIVIPFFTKDKKIHAFQGRSIDPKENVKYISIVVDEKHPLIWGLDKIDEKKSIYVFEGVLDAIFVKNSVAICGSNFNVLTMKINRDMIVVCYDNEPHSKETKKKIASSVEKGFKVVILPNMIIQKDINQMIIDGYSEDYIESLLKENTYQGLAAFNRLSEWSKQ